MPSPEYVDALRPAVALFPTPDLWNVVAQSWEDAGIPADTARAWAEVGITNVQWYQRFIESGLTPEQVKPVALMFHNPALGIDSDEKRVGLVCVAHGIVTGAAVPLDDTTVATIGGAIMAKYLEAGLRAVFEEDLPE